MQASSQPASHVLRCVLAQLSAVAIIVMIRVRVRVTVRVRVSAAGC